MAKVFGIMKSVSYAAFLVALAVFLSGAQGSAPFYAITNSVFKVQALSGGGGTGFVVQAKSGTPVTVTNWHVCRASRDGQMLATAEGHYSQVIIKILGTDIENDLCVLDAPPMSALRMGEAPQRYAPLYALGYPGLRLKTPSEGYYVGEVNEPVPFLTPPSVACPNGTTRAIENPYYCLRTFRLGNTTLRIAPGNSGSPVVDENGNVVGVINSVDTDGSGAMIPIRFLRALLEKY